MPKTLFSLKDRVRQGDSSLVSLLSHILLKNLPGSKGSKGKGSKGTFFLLPSFHHFPLSNHKDALQAALAPEAAGRQNIYWDMYNILNPHAHFFTAVFIRRVIS
jgi:hypothetical protein